MSTVWMTLLKFALNVAIAAVNRIPVSQWDKLGGIIAAWLLKLEDSLPAGSPLITMLNYYRAPMSKLNRPHEDDE